MALHPSSVLHPSSGGGANKRPRWVVYHEFVHTSQSYLRVCSEVSAEWLLEAAPRYYDPASPNNLSWPDCQAKRAFAELMQSTTGPRSSG